MKETAIAPVQPDQRISEIDIIRGLALLGILMVNMSFFKYPVFFERYPSGFSEGLDQLASWIIQLFFTGKFYAIFSFLFGLGFFIFMERTISKGFDLIRLYRRRLFALLVIGFVHLFFVWSGDILFTYALIGFILIKFRSKSIPALRRWIIGLYITAILLNFLLGLINGIGVYFAGDSYAYMMQQMIDEAVAVYLTGSLTELIYFRLFNEVPYVLLSLVIWIPAVLAFFLCGLYAGKIKVFNNIPGHLPLLRKVRNIGLPVGTLLMFFYYLVETGSVPTGVIIKPALLSTTNYAASLFIFPAYVALIVLALQKDFWKNLLSPVAAAGRMALTNYLLQTLICLLIFYGFGFGYYAGVSAAAGLIITLLIYLVQVFWSNLWFKKFRFGPLEWLWRMVTYRRREKLLRS